MSELYSNDHIRKNAEDLVSREILLCVSTLVSQIARPEKGDSTEVCEALGLSWEDDLLPLLETSDYEEAARWHIEESMDAGDLQNYLDERGVEYEAAEEDDEGDEVEGTGTQIEELRKLALAAAEEGGFDSFCNDHNLEPERSEVYEHWACTSWLANKLEERGHPVARDFLGLTIWGRGTTGQSISMDSVMLNIALEIWGDKP